MCVYTLYAVSLLESCTLTTKTDRHRRSIINHSYRISLRNRATLRSSYRWESLYSFKADPHRQTAKPIIQKEKNDKTTFQQAFTQPQTIPRYHCASNYQSPRTNPQERKEKTDAALRFIAEDCFVCAAGCRSSSGGHVEAGLFVISVLRSYLLRFFVSFESGRMRRERT